VLYCGKINGTAIRTGCSNGVGAMVAAQALADGSDAVRRRIERKLMLWLIVPIALVTFVNSIDRVNLSYAGHALSADLGLTPEQFGLSVSMFFLAYLVFQYPHARLLRAWGIRPWILLSMSLWGLSGVWMSQVRSSEELYAARFLLGVAEAGFAPGMTWLITQWTPAWMRARALSGALVAVPLSMVLGGPLCGWLLGLEATGDLAAWRFMFLLLAVPNFVLALIAAIYFVDRPEQARWLTPEERAWLAEALAEPVREAGATAASFGSLARDPWLWRCALAWLLVMTGSYALVFWLPQLVRQLDLGGSEFLIGTLAALPLLGLAVGLVLNGRHSDRSGERLLHTGLPAAAAGMAMMIAAFLPAGWPVLGLLVVAGLGIGATQGVFWAIPAAVKLGGERPPVGAIALISMFGTAGGIVGPWLTGVLVAASGGFSTAIAVLAALLAVALLVIGFDRAGRTAAGTTMAGWSSGTARPETRSAKC
jgi:ACS family tartrate transporter-like MFS transporter